MHHRLTPIEAARFGKSIEQYRLFWMEDPTPAENRECFRLIRQHTVTPIAVGEVFNSIWDCKQLIEEQLIDYIRTTITHAGGITGMRRIADFASLYQVRTGSHGPSDLSPVCMAAALHFDLWVPNFGVQEYMGYSEQMLEVFPHNWTFDNGYMHPGDKPGLGIEFDEKLAAKYPYDPAYLPVARPKMARCGTGKYKFYVRKMLINPIPYRRLNLWLVQSILKNNVDNKPIIRRVASASAIGTAAEL